MANAESRLRILLLEDDEFDAALIEHELRKTGMPFELHRVWNEAAFREALNQGTPDLILSDLKMNGYDGLEALKLAHQLVPTVPFIMVTGSATEEIAVQCMKAGASDYVIKQHWVRLGSAVQSVLKQLEIRSQHDRAERALRESEARNRAVLDAALDCVITIDNEGRIVEFNPAAERTFGFRRRDVIGQSMAELIVPHDLRPMHRTGFARHISGGEGTILDKRIEMRSLRADGTEFPAEMAITRIDLEGKTYFTAYLRDITERKHAEERIRNSLQEKEVMLKEIHHRVKNNLQIISSLFNLEASSTPNPEVSSVLKEHRDRVQAMALVHEQLYSSTNFARVDFADYLRRLTSNLVRSLGREQVTAKFEMEKIVLGVDTAIACGLIVNELVSNALKHAFPEGRRGTISVVLRTGTGGAPVLVIEDDGVGLPDIDWKKPRSLGLQLVNILCDQLHAKLTVTQTNGTRFEIVFSEPRPTQKL